MATGGNLRRPPVVTPTWPLTGQATGLPASLSGGTAEAPGSRAARRAVAPATRSALEAGGAVPQACAARETCPVTTNLRQTGQRRSQDLLRSPTHGCVRGACFGRVAAAARGAQIPATPPRSSRCEPARP